MAEDEILSDDYVATLLAAEAKQSTIKYSAMGLEAFAPSRPPTNKPKPNTRFLRNIIKDTDSHNAALLAKEAADSKARLRELTKSERPKAVSGGDIRKRQLGDIASILGGGSRRRKIIKEDLQGGHESSRRDHESKRNGLGASKHGRDHEENERESKRHRSDRRRESNSENDGRRRERRKRDKSRSRSPIEERKDGRRHRDRSPRRRRSRSRERKKASGQPEQCFYSTRDRVEAKKVSRRSPSPPQQKDDDSDPLDDIIGPRPPPKVQSRGRGTTSAASGIDSRFSQGYDPTTDVKVDIDEENDWEQALEALRDRQKWKQQGADRLRAAGFTDEEVKKWEKGGEKREEDVTWAKKGEGREWDRGKVMDDEGVVTFDPSYGRLNDS